MSDHKKDEGEDKDGHRDFLRVFRGSPRKVQMQLSIEVGAITIAWVAFALLLPVRADDVSIAWVGGPIVFFYWAFMRLLPLTYLSCSACEGMHNKSTEPPCAECSMRLEMPSQFKRYEPRSRKEVGWWYLGYIPKASRAEWKDERWER